MCGLDSWPSFIALSNEHNGSLFGSQLRVLLLVLVAAPSGWSVACTVRGGLGRMV